MPTSLSIDNIVDYLIALLEPLVDWPNEIKVDTITDERGILFTISLAKSDYGKIIGRQGMTIHAIRIIIRNIGIKNGKAIGIKTADEKMAETGDMDFVNNTLSKR